MSPTPSRAHHHHPRSWVLDLSLKLFQQSNRAPGTNMNLEFTKYMRLPNYTMIFSLNKLVVWRTTHVDIQLLTLFFHLCSCLACIFNNPRFFHVANFSRNFTRYTRRNKISVALVSIKIEMGVPKKVPRTSTRVIWSSTQWLSNVAWILCWKVAWWVGRGFPSGFVPSGLLGHWFAKWSPLHINHPFNGPFLVAGLPKYPSFLPTMLLLLLFTLQSLLIHSTHYRILCPLSFEIISLH